jgi:hypothetical protein
MPMMTVITSIGMFNEGSRPGKMPAVLVLMLVVVSVLVRLLVSVVMSTRMVVEINVLKAVVVSVVVVLSYTTITVVGCGNGSMVVEFAAGITAALAAGRLES